MTFGILQEKEKVLVKAVKKRSHRGQRSNIPTDMSATVKLPHCPRHIGIQDIIALPKNSFGR